MTPISFISLLFYYTLWIYTGLIETFISGPTDTDKASSIRRNICSFRCSTNFISLSMFYAQKHFISLIFKCIALFAVSLKTLARKSLPFQFSQASELIFAASEFATCSNWSSYFWLFSSVLEVSLFLRR